MYGLSYAKIIFVEKKNNDTIVLIAEMIKEFRPF